MYGNANLIHGLAWSLRRALQASPTQRLFRELRRRGVPLSRMDALEMFGGDGGRHTIDYRRQVRRLDVWEVDSRYAASLHKNLPGARIKVTDSFREIEATKDSYDLIVIDNPGGLFGPEHRYCEHFEIFTPSLFRLVREPAVIILNVFPVLQPGDSRERYARRAAFYETEHPERLPIDQMLAAYRRVAGAAGFDLPWHVSLRRTWRSEVHYLAMSLVRQRPKQDSAVVCLEESTPRAVQAGTEV